MIRLSNLNLLFVFLFLFHLSGKSQDLFNAESSKKFARYLFSTQQYQLAANEFERILNLEPNDTLVYMNLLQSYRFGENCQTSFNNLNALNADRFFVNPSIASEYLKLSLTCNCCYQQNYFNEALHTLDKRNQVFYQLGLYVLAENKDSLIRFSHRHKELLTNNYPSLLQKVNEIENFNEKSPALAAAMSAIIPGSGKAYSGFWGDAVMSLVFVSSNAWLSYKGFNKKGVESANGWIFGSISMGFYLGNVWGSGKAAKDYNRIEYEKMYKDAKGSIYTHF